MWPRRSRAWKARPVPSFGPDAAPMPQVRPECDRPLLTVKDRQWPMLRARGGHGRRGRRPWLWRSSDGHKLNRRVRPSAMTTCLVGKGGRPAAVGLRGSNPPSGDPSGPGVGCSAATLRFLSTRRGRWCPPRFRCDRCGTGPARTGSALPTPARWSVPRGRGCGPRGRVPWPGPRAARGCG
jgi:hypothetical protein